VESDGVRAKLVEFGRKERRLKMFARKPLFVKGDAERSTQVTTKGKLKSEIIAEKSRLNLKDTLVRNSRANNDPFLADRIRKPKAELVPILKENEKLPHLLKSARRHNPLPLR